MIVFQEVYHRFRLLNFVFVLGTTIVSFYRPGARLRFLGGPSMVFKPRMLFTTYVSAFNADGTKFLPGFGRFIRIYTETDLGQSQTPINYPIDSSAIVRHQFLAPSDSTVTFIRLRAELYDNDVLVPQSEDEQRAIRYLSPSNSYLQVTSQTESARVGNFMLFRVNVTQYVDFVYYHIISAGQLIFSNILSMDGARQKTFDLAISRRMAPSAHILVYYVRYDGEIVADSFNFHVNTSSVTNHVNITINRRKDFTGNTIEVLAYASPQSIVAFAALGLVQTRLFPPGNHLTSVMVRFLFLLDKTNENVFIVFRFMTNCIHSIVMQQRVFNTHGFRMSMFNRIEFFFRLNRSVMTLVQHLILQECKCLLMFE